MAKILVASASKVFSCSFVIVPVDQQKPFPKPFRKEFPGRSLWFLSLSWNHDQKNVHHGFSPFLFNLVQFCSILLNLVQFCSIGFWGCFLALPTPVRETGDNAIGSYVSRYIAVWEGPRFTVGEPSLTPIRRPAPAKGVRQPVSPDISSSILEHRLPWLRFWRCLKVRTPRRFRRSADLEIGEPKLGLPPAGLETCATPNCTRRRTPGVVQAKRRAGGTHFLSANFSISVFSFSFINAPFYHAFTAFLSQEGQDIFQKCEKHWEIEGFLGWRTNDLEKRRGTMGRALRFGGQ